jgi:hypothetical protein
MSEIFYYKNDNMILVKGLADFGGDKQDGKTVKVTLKDSDGEEVTGLAWPLTLTAEGGDTGNYSGLLPDSLGVSIGETYFATIEVYESTDLQATFNVRVRVLQRGET